MADEVRFRAGLFRGCAGYYDRYRLPYPEAMITDLVRRAQVAEGGRLLDLACGTGQLTFPLRRWFRRGVGGGPGTGDGGSGPGQGGRGAEVGAAKVRAVVASAEDLDAEPESFALAVVGNAFHRLDRDLVAGRCLSWLRPGGGLALCWSSQPWIGEAAWQRALAAMLGPVAGGARRPRPDTGRMGAGPAAPP